MSTLTGCIQGLGLLGPGLADWGAARAVLSGELPHVAARTVLPLPALPPAERRRAGRVIKLALAVGAEALANGRTDAPGAGCRPCSAPRVATATTATKSASRWRAATG